MICCFMITITIAGRSRLFYPPLLHWKTAMAVQTVGSDSVQNPAKVTGDTRTEGLSQGCVQ